MSNGISFSTLRAANLARVGHFKNNLGQPAHARPDGSDWSVGMWLCAKLGEIGEFCRERVDYEEGRIDWPTYADRAAKELADDVIYTDLLAARALDVPLYTGSRTKGVHSVEQQVLTVMAVFGAYCEARKKAQRGDADTPAGYEQRKLLLGQAIRELEELEELEQRNTWSDGTILRSIEADTTMAAHSEGVNLGEAVRQKWNEVSARVGYPMRLDAASDSEGGEV